MNKNKPSTTLSTMLKKGVGYMLEPNKLITLQAYVFDACFNRCAIVDVNAMCDLIDIPRINPVSAKVNGGRTLAYATSDIDKLTQSLAEHFGGDAAKLYVYRLFNKTAINQMAKGEMICEYSINREEVLIDKRTSGIIIVSKYQVVRDGIMATICLDKFKECLNQGDTLTKI